MIILHAIILATLLATLLGTLCNLVFFRSLDPRDAAPAAGKVSILVPARDEERSIGQCAASLLAQDYPDFELIVLDDASSDATGPIVERLLAGQSRHRLLRGHPLPAGWVGKNWACHQLSQAATGDWLLFTDADTIHAPHALSAALAMARRHRADLCSPWPRLVTVTLGEKLVIPVLHILALGWFPMGALCLLQRFPRLAGLLPRRNLRGLGAANGQYMLFRRAAYEAIGGHAAVQDHLVEDVALGREMALRIPEGLRLWNCDGAPLIDCRMYWSFREVCDGFTKNARAAFEGDIAAWCIVGGLQFLAFFFPFVLLFFPSQWRYSLPEAGLVYLLRAMMIARMRTSWLGGLLHPVGHCLAMGIGIRSWIKTNTRGVQWKGRTYRPGYQAPRVSS